MHRDEAKYVIKISKGGIGLPACLIRGDAFLGKKRRKREDRDATSSKRLTTLNIAQTIVPIGKTEDGKEYESVVH